MRILLTNDDGIHAPGLAALERIARTLSDDVWIVAPETDQSGLAHSLTLNNPLRLRKISDRHFAVNGTPTDCVIMGIQEVMGGKPDLVLSGVNSGANMADDVTYSGTVAGAMEGALQGIRAIAMSQAYIFDGERKVPWEVAETHAPALLDKLMGVEHPANTFLNVNFPNCGVDAVKGIQVTAQGKLTFGMIAEQRRDGRGFPYYWLKFDGRKSDLKPGTDVNALSDGFISVTPLKLDLTDHAAREAVVKALSLE